MAGLKEALEGIRQKFMDSFAKGDAEGAASLYTDDCKIIPPGEDIISGKKDALKMLKKWLESGTKVTSINIVDFDGSDSSAWCIQEVQFEGKAGVARNVLTYKKVGGKWCVHLDIWNSK